MRETFRTEAEARAYRYGKWAGNLRGQAYDPACCAAEFMPNERGALARQCGRKRGLGPEKLYCSAHSPDKVAAKNKARDDAYRAEQAAQDSITREAKALAKALGINASAVYQQGYGSRMGGYVRRLGVSFEDARTLIARLTRTPTEPSQ